VTPKRALIVDDVDRWRHVFRDILVDMGIHADTADGGAAAVELLRRGRYDLLVVDVVLSPAAPPAESQLFFRLLQREYPDLPVIAVTGADLSPPEAFRLAGLGARELIHKPRFLLEDFRSSVRRVLAESPPRPEPEPRPDPRYDAFVSYSRADRDWVHRVLVPGLEAGGLRLCLDSRDFVPGAFSLTEMERCVRESRRMLLVLTPAYLRSEWTRFEAALAQTLDPDAGQRRLLPILLEPCEPPLRISALSHADFTDGGDIQLHLSRLAVAIRGG
jgi:CheY-like chemotaxis protein